MPHDAYKALYIHIRVFVSRCEYCDFQSGDVASDEARMRSYVEERCAELRRLAKAGELAEIKTIYIGGGTPTYLGHALLTQLLYTISLSVNLEQVEEFCVEANPESLTEALVKDMFALGVNRLSLGVQSFDDEILATLGRAHTAARAHEAIKEAQSRFTNISIDLMCGIPHQSDDVFVQSLREACDAGVTHVSIYPLTVELNTPLADMIAEGRMPDIDEDDQARQMELAEEVLGQAGFVRYEVSNYALPGFESKHNTSYWQGVPYLGLGESACTMTQNAQRRMRKIDDLITDNLNPAQMLAEDLMLSMRLSQGVSVEQVEQAETLLPRVSTCFAELQDLGLVELTDNRYKPTKQGWLCGNELYGRIFDLA